MRNTISTLSLLSFLMLSLATSACGVSEEVGRTRIVDGFQAPESAAYDPATRSWYVSNVAGNEPGDGFISRVSFDGQLLESRFFTGLDDPKGVRVHQGHLYVADPKRLVVIDLSDPEQAIHIDVPEAGVLNDVTLNPDTGAVYVSDTIANAIYRFDGSDYQVIYRDPALAAPNGVSFAKDSLLIASIGPNLDPATFTAEGPGRVSRLNLATLELAEVTEPLGALDGLEQERNSLLLSEFYTGVYRILPDGSRRLLIDNSLYGLACSADIGFEPKSRRVAVPELLGTRVAFFDLEFNVGHGHE